MELPKIDLKEYEYTLPNERIAKYPLQKRDESKLLQYDKGVISHFHFKDIIDLLPSESLLVYNDTKVIPARLIFQRQSGARIEIFLLQPISPTTVIPEIMLAKHPVVWKTMIGHLKKWKNEEILEGKLMVNGKTLSLKATLLDREKREVEFSWDQSEIAFVDVVEASGEVPLPPYLNRKPEEEDKNRYQTVYSAHKGAVAAPTAGLHFTPEILECLRNKGVQEAQVTLHVSAGTFQPIKAETITEHPMHSEQLVVDKTTIEKISKNLRNIVAVGTTSVRTIESLYWYGVNLVNELESEFKINKLAPYREYKHLPTPMQAYQAILSEMDKRGLDTLIGSTEIFIIPGYQFKIVKGLITNFHQPGSTLILLIASILGDDWKRVYEQALANEYRFLSYGDSSLLWIE